MPIISFVTSAHRHVLCLSLIHISRDFKAELLRTQITESAQAQKGNIKDSSRSLEAHYLILNHLLNTNDYDTAETDCNIQLVNTGNDKKEKWKIQRTNSLEDDLVGGLIADLALSLIHI